MTGRGRRSVPDVVVLNGGSSAGTSTIVRLLQEQLPDVWLTFGTDAFVEALPGHGDSPRADIAFHADGTVVPGPTFRERERAWYVGLAAMARAGAPLLLDEVFLAGGAGQERMRELFEGLDLLWVGIRCDAATAAAREAARGDRVTGMARDQAVRVHEGMRYDLEVDTAAMTPQRCAQVVADRVLGPGG